MADRRVRFGSNDTKVFDKDAAPSGIPPAPAAAAAAAGQAAAGQAAAGSASGGGDQMAMMAQMMAMMSGGLGASNPSSLPPGMGGPGMGGPGMGGMPAAFDMAGASAQADAMGGMKLDDAKQRFLDQARAAKGDGKRYWGPGGTGGIQGQSAIDTRTHEYAYVPVRSGRSDPYGPYGIDGDDRSFKVPAPPSQQFGASGGASGGAPPPPSSSSRGTLMTAATIAGTKLAGKGEFGSGYSAEEIGALDARYNAEAATAKYVFASDKVRGGYLATERKARFKARGRVLASEREEREEREAEGASSGYEILGDGGGGGVRADSLAPKQVNNAPPEHGSDSDSDQETMVDVSVPDSLDPSKTRTVRDKLSRFKRREARKALASNRVHQIMEMAPEDMRELRAEIGRKREVAKAKKREVEEANRRTEEGVLDLDGDDGLEEDFGGEDDLDELAGAAEGGIAQPSSAGRSIGNAPLVPPPPPQPASPRPAAAGNTLNSTDHLRRLLKSHNDVVSAVEETISTDA